MTLKNKVSEIIHYLVGDFHQPVTTRLFFKAVVLLTAVKILMLWSFSHRVMEHHRITLPGSWWGKLIFAPSFLANENVDIFFGIALAFLALAFFASRHYITTALFFWLTFNLYIVYLPFATGADLVLFMLALWYIPLVERPIFTTDTATVIQKGCYNAGLILCQLQVVFIYLVSGVDKASSSTWRSGEAFNYITHLDSMFNPLFIGVFDDPWLQLILSWMTIIFELAFVVLIWFDKTRITIIVIGLFFHLFTWIVLSLPDFASIMIISYILFLKDTDYERLPRRIRRWLL